MEAQHRVHSIQAAVTLRGAPPFLLAALVQSGFLFATPAFSQTWIATPSTIDWNDAANWSPAVVPDGATAVAQFGTSDSTGIVIDDDIELATLRLIATDATAYQFDIQATGRLTLLGTGIENQSATRPDVFVQGGVLTFDGVARAANAFVYNDATDGASSVLFLGHADAALAEIITTEGALTRFSDSASAGNARLSTGGNGSLTEFSGSASAEAAYVRTFGGARTIFRDNATAGSASFETHVGGSLEFHGSSTGGNAYMLNLDGVIDISGLTSAGMTAGAIEGQGELRLGSRNLQTGSLHSDTYYAGVISGAGGSLTKVGFGTLMLGNANTYSGGTTIAGGVLNIASDASLGDAAGGLTFDGGMLQKYTSGGLSTARTITLEAGGGMIVTNNASTTTLSGAISGTGALTKVDTGTLRLTGSNSYSGGTIVNGGTLEGDSASLQGDIDLTLSGTVLRFVQATDGTYAGALSGYGRLEKHGAGTLIMTGSDVRESATEIHAGTLAFDGATVDIGSLSLRQGALIATGGSSVEIANSLIVGSTANGVAGNGSMLIENGATVLNFVGTIASGAVAGGTAARGDVTVDGAGSLWYSQFGVVQVGSGVSSTATLTVANGGEVRADRANSSASSVLLGVGSQAVGMLNIGTGGAAGTVTARIVNSGSGGSGIVNFNHNDTSYTFAPRMDGRLHINHIGSGTTILTSNNTYTGGTSLYDGTLAISADTNLGNAAGSLTFDGGTLRTDAALSSARSVTIDSGGGSVATNGFDVTLSGVLAGNGALAKEGAGTLTLTGTNSFGGGTLLRGGVVAISADSNIGASTGALTFDGGTLRLMGEIESARAITLDAGGGTLDVLGTSLNLSGDIAGGGSLTKTGAGTLIMTGDNSYTGGTTIASGTLQGDARSLQGSMVNDGAVVFEQSTAGTHAGSISGAGSLTKTGAGTLTLTGTNSYTGGTTISDGVLQGNSASLQGDIVNDASVIFQQGTDGAYAGSMSGAGSLAKNGAGTLTLAGTNSYTGGTTISDGALRGNSASLQGAIVNHASVVFDQAVDGTYAGAMSGSGSLTKQGSGTLTLSGANTYSGGTAVTAGALRGDTTSLRGSMANDASVVFDQTATGSFAGVMTGSGSLTKAGDGTLVLNSINAYSGGTRIDAGMLSISADRNLGAAAGALAFTGGTLQTTSAFATARTATLGVEGGGFDVTGGTTLTYNGAIGGGGELRKLGQGTLILNNANSYSGGTQIVAGTLRGNTASLRGNISNQASLVFDQQTDGVYNNVISGTGTLTKLGTAALTLNGNQTYTGATLVDRGTLFVVGSLASPVMVGSNATFGGAGAINGAVTVASGGTLAPGIFAGSTGVLSINGPLTLTAGSRLEVDVDPTGNSDRVQVIGPSGVATIQGSTLRLEAGGNNYQRNTVYTVLTASGGVNGTFDAVSTNLAFLTPSLAYDPNAVHVTLTRNDVSFSEIATTRNQQAVARYLDAAHGIEPLMRSFENLSADQARLAFVTIGGEGLSSLPRASAAGTARAHEMIATRLAIGGEDGAAFKPVDGHSMLSADAEQSTAGAWARGIGARGAAADGEEASGYSWDTTGTAVGIESRFGSRLLLGASAIHTRSEVAFGADRRSSGSITSPQALVYGSYTIVNPPERRSRRSARHVQLRGSLGYGRHEYETERLVEVGSLSSQVQGAHEAQEWSLQGQVEFIENLGEFRLQALLGARYIRQQEAGYSESGGVPALRVEEATLDSIAATFGARMVRPMFSGRGQLEARALWSRELNDTDPAVTAALAAAPEGDRFNVAGVPIFPDTFTLGASISARLRDHIFIYADYKAELWRSGRDEQSVIAGVSYLW